MQFINHKEPLVNLSKMVITMRYAALLLVALMFVCETMSSNYVDNPEIGAYTEDELAAFAPYIANQEYIRQIHSLINAYKADMLDGRMVIETNALIDTKYKTWKRNADLINSILALPKGMNDAGR